MASRESFGETSPDRVRERKGRGVEGLEANLNGNHLKFEVNTRAVSRG